MTYRLIGLMSVVLLVSLGASAFLMSQQQAAVMDEVARTVSSVGRATLSSFEFDRLPERVAASDAGAEVRAEIRDDPKGMVRREVRVITTTDRLSFEGETTVVRTGNPTDSYEWCHGPANDCVVLVGESDGKGISRVIQLEQIRAEGGPGEGLLLKIPTVLSPDASAERREDIVLEVPTSRFAAIFSGFRGKSLMIFLVVFLLGTALSAGVAARFTRPIRALDGAIRRLSEGHLDVEVNARGSDEMARLGNAFNEMARSLRAARERSREVQRREKLSALGRLAAGVAHDVRNPLHSVGLTLQNLQDTCRPEASDRAGEFDRSIGIIREEIQRLDKLVDNFLAFARTERRERCEVDLIRLARETARLVEKEAARRGITIEVRTDDDVPPVPVEAESVRSSLLNLVLNSFEAMPEGGRVELAVRRDDGHVVLEVADTGEGIRDEDQERVFEFAYTTRERGNGLGLAMVHQVVVEEHGGRVSLESRPGEGTRITLWFPRSPAGSEQAA